MERDPFKATRRLMHTPGCQVILSFLKQYDADHPGLRFSLVGADGTKRIVRCHEAILHQVFKLPPVTIRRAFLMLQRYEVIETVRRKHGKYTVMFDIKTIDMFIYMAYALDGRVEMSAMDASVQRVVSGDYRAVTFQKFSAPQITKKPNAGKQQDAAKPPAQAPNKAPGNSDFTELPASSMAVKPHQY